MRIITLHSDFIEYEAVKEAIKNPPKADKGVHREEECLVVFMASEEGDAEGVSKKVAKEIEEVAKQVKVKKIVLYPWVHLTSTPAAPGEAQKAIGEVAKELEGKYEIVASPFGWYKSFNIKVKGHPLSELSREIREGAKEEGPKEAKNAALESEKKMVSTAR